MDNKKHLVTTTKCLVLPTKRLVAAAKILVAATKTLSVVPNFVAVTKPFFFRATWGLFFKFSDSLLSGEIKNFVSPGWFTN